jgi:LacI family transcriptional regulator
VGPTTRERILELVAENGFTANATAQQLSTGRAGAIGIVFPFRASELETRPDIPALLGSIGDTAARSGYDILLISVPSAAEVGRIANAVSRQRIDGLVLPAAGPRDPSVREVVDLGFPAVIIGHRGRAGGLPWVDASHDSASFELTRLMIDGGRRRLVLLNGPPEVSACTLRSKGFWSAIEASMGAVDGAEEHAVGFAPDAIAAICAQLLAKPARSRPTAIVAASDAIAAACLDAACSAGLSVPRDVAVSGFDDLPFSAYTTPSLTTVRMPFHELGTAAAEMLVSLIEGRPLRRRRIVLATEVIVRESTPVRSPVRGSRRSPNGAPPAPARARVRVRA